MSANSSAACVLDWRALGIPDWLADRAERLQLRFPTGEVPSGFSRLARSWACWQCSG